MRKGEFIEVYSFEKIFNDLKYVAKAASKDKYKDILQNIYVKDKLILASDGYRLHAAINNELPDGQYKIIKIDGGKIILGISGDEYDISNYLRIITLIDFNLPRHNIDNSDHWPLDTLIKKLPDNLSIEHKYFKDAYKLGSKVIYNDKMITFITKTTIAIVAPYILRRTEDE